METFALCPFRVGTLLWEAQPGQRTLTVTVKATFLLVPGGEAVPAPEQDPIGDDQHWEESALGSLFRPADLAPMKRRVDLALVGHAYAPRGEPVPSLTARLRVGDFTKTLEIKGDQLWTNGPDGLTVGAPIPFVKMPLRYERAPLGPDNPVGVDVDAPASLGALARANLDHASAPAVAVGFGPITPTWRPRRKLLDEAGLFWAYGLSAPGGPAGPAPAGFNFEFFNTSPRDQQIDLLRAGAVIELENLSRTHPRLTTQLPAIRPQVFRIDPRTGRSEEIVLRCDTLWIDTDRGVAVLSFRGLCDVGAGGEESIGKLLVAADPQGKKLRFDRVEQMLREQQPGCLGPARPTSSASPENDPLALRYDTVKAARAPAAPPSIAAPRAPAESAPRLDWQPSLVTEESTADLPRNEEEHHDRTRDISQMPRRKAPLPFQGASAAPGIAAFVPAPAPKEAPLPRSASNPATEPPPAPSIVVPPPLPLPPPLPVAPPIAVAPPLPLAEVPNAQAPAAPLLQGLPPPPAMLGPLAVSAETEAPPVQAPPLPPPMLGPIAAASAPEATEAEPEPPPEATTKKIRGADVAAAVAEKASKSTVKLAAPPAAASAPRVAATPSKAAPSEPDPAPAEVPIDRYAAISAALARKGVDRGAVLRAHKLSIAGWGAIDRHWKRALAEQNDRGDKALLHAFDVAYVRAQSELHRPIGVREYARILVGLERGDVGRVLADLELQLSDLMRLQRVWSKRVTDSPELTAELATILDELRKPAS